MSREPEKSSKSPYTLLIEWLWVGIPLAWGVTETVLKAKVMFK